LLRHREADKCDAQNALSREVEGTVLPFLKRLKGANNDKNQTRLINILEDNLQQLVKSMARYQFIFCLPKLTPAKYKWHLWLDKAIHQTYRNGLCLSPALSASSQTHTQEIRIR